MSEEVKEERWHCNNCREYYDAKGVKKEALDYVQDPATGKIVAEGRRFSVFCKLCGSKITIVDPDSSQMLQNFTKKPS